MLLRVGVMSLPPPPFPAAAPASPCSRGPLSPGLRACPGHPVLCSREVWAAHVLSLAPVVTLHCVCPGSGSCSQLLASGEQLAVEVALGPRRLVAGAPPLLGRAACGALAFRVCLHTLLTPHFFSGTRLCPDVSDQPKWSAAGLALFPLLTLGGWLIPLGLLWSLRWGTTSPPP